MKLSKQNKIIIIILLLLPFFYCVYVYYTSYDMLRQTQRFKPALATQIYDVNGVLISEIFEENRNYINIARVPQHVKMAFLTAEDQHFYAHSGIDLPGILRAMAVNLYSGEIRQGGSTITQQLIKQVYTGSEKSLRRKFVELLLAYKFEKRLTKDMILEMYLNQIYFGHGVYGIGAAARFFFNCNVEQLTVSQAAILAGIPSAPNRYSPIRNPRAAYDRSRQILRNMIASGFVDKSTASDEFASFWEDYFADISTKYHTLGVRNITSDKAPHFTEYIRQILISKYGKERVYRGGLKVYTTLNLNYQEIAQSLIKEATERQNQIAVQTNRYRMKSTDALIVRGLLSKRKLKSSERQDYIDFLTDMSDTTLEEIVLCSLLFGNIGIESKIQSYLERFENLRQSAKVEGAMVAISPKDGAILVMIGGSEFNSINQLNRVVQSRRQPGSSFKPFVFAAGIEHKLMTAATAFLDAPIVFRGKRKFWTPSNYDKSFYGMVLARKALAYSLNIVSVLVYELVGGRRIANLASRLIQVPVSRFTIDPTLALGTTELTPLEMATGFAVFANQGKSVCPYSIRYILDQNEKKLFDGSNTRRGGEQVISKETAFIMTSLLREVVDHGTATKAIRSVAEFSLPAAGKTGTNTKFRDAWFVGYTQDIVAAVWLGCDSQNYILGSGQSAAVVAAPVWGKLMKEIYKTRKYTPFNDTPPSGVSKMRICSKSGEIPNQDCPVMREYFITGTEPKQECSGQHSEMISIFDLVKKDKGKLIERMKLELSSDGEAIDESKVEGTQEDQK